MLLNLDPKLASKFPGLSARITHIRGVHIEEERPDLEAFRVTVLNEAIKRWNIEELKENPVFKAYRDFFWKMKIDPTKTRPAAEALLRRVLRGTPLPKINTLVDAYNLASLSTIIPFGAFDTDKMRGEPLMREATPSEKFLGIGMDVSIQLSGGEVVIQDDEKIIAVYPYRDAVYSKVTTSTKNLLLMTCGVPRIGDKELRAAEMVGVEYITRFCDGVAS